MLKISYDARSLNLWRSFRG